MLWEAALNVGCSNVVSRVETVGIQGRAFTQVLMNDVSW